MTLEKIIKRLLRLPRYKDALAYHKKALQTGAVPTYNIKNGGFNITYQESNRKPM